MVEQATIRGTQASRGIRPFNPAHDLGALANLIEAAFADDLSVGGQAAVDEMRSLRWMGPFVYVLGMTSGFLRDFFAGYVWIEGGKIAGNVTISRSHDYRGEWIVSNLAVYPEYRRRGIARRLMESAIEHVLERKGEWISLQVKADNSAAKSLYHKLGFHILDTLSELHAKRLSPPPSLPGTGYKVISPDPRRFEAVHSLEKEVVSDLLQKMRPLRPEGSQRRWAPGRVTWLGELMQGIWTRRRWVQQGDKPVAAVQMTVILGSDSHRTTFLIHPAHKGHVEGLLAAVLCQLAQRAPRRHTVAKIRTKYPRLIEELERVGFRHIRTLDVMGLPLQH